MSGKLNVYGLGQFGVNRTKSPTQLADGEFLQAQNAQADPRGSQLALRKRDGMLKINASAAAGQILQIYAVRFTDPDEEDVPTPGTATVLYQAQGRFSDPTIRWRRSTDGDTFADVAEPAFDIYVAAGVGGLAYFGNGEPFPSTPNIQSWDGSIATELVAKPAFTSTPYQDFPTGRVFWVGAGGVAEYASGVMTTYSIGSGLEYGTPRGIAAFNGDPYIGTNQDSSQFASTIYRWNGSSWAKQIELDTTFSLSVQRIVVDLMVFDGALYAFCALGQQTGTRQQEAGNRIFRSTDGSTWTDVTPGSGNTGGWYSPCVFDSKLWALRGAEGPFDTGTPFEGLQVWSRTTGGTWTMEKDLNADFGALANFAPTYYRQLIEFNSRLFVHADGNGMSFRRNTDGSWADITPASELDPDGFFWTI